MEDSSTLKHHDIVPGAQLSMHIWSSWLSLIQACVTGNVQKVKMLLFKTWILRYIILDMRKNWVK